MSAPRSLGKARFVLSLLVLCGGATLAIPFFLTPPAYLDVVLRDAVFASDLTSRRATVTDGNGLSFQTPVENIGGDYVARVGRINSGAGAFTVQLDGFKNGTARVDAPPLQEVRTADRKSVV